MRDWILLDSQSNVDIFCNSKLVTDIILGAWTLLLATNAGVLSTSHTATLPGYGSVWFNEDAITNVVSLYNMTQKYRVTFDSAVEQAFIVHSTPPMRFVRNRENLYVYIPDPSLHTGTNFVNTVSENMSYYTKRQVERATEARKLLQSLAYPTMSDLKAIIKMNSIQDCPVTVEDVDMAERIFGKDIASIKGKSTRSKPKSAVHHTVAIPPELVKIQHNVDLCIDTIFVNEMPFLTSISKRIMYRTAQWIPNRELETYEVALTNVLKVYNRGGFHVTRVFADNEFRPLLDSVQDEHKFKPHLASAKAHVPEIERSNRVTKERVRAQFHNAPFKSLPRKLVKELVETSQRKLNYFPAKGGCSHYYSPREILHQVKLHYSSCSVPFLSYVEAHNETNPTNSMQERAISALYVSPLETPQGGHRVYDLKTQNIVTRQKVTVLPITPSIIAHVEAIAKKDDMKGLKITTKTGKVLYDSAWIAGVDYMDEDDQIPIPDRMRLKMKWMKMKKMSMITWIPMLTWMIPTTTKMYQSKQVPQHEAHEAQVDPVSDERRPSG